MDVYMINPGMTMACADQAEAFSDKVKKSLEQYIPVRWISAANIHRYRNEINEESLIVLFNDKSSGIENEELTSLYAKAKETRAHIWAVALEKESRIPADIISEYQSYDVWEQLRSRNLGKEYFDSAAEAFSRKIISQAMPMLYSEKGQLFVSHRRLDGEEITAGLCSQICTQSVESTFFRDVINVQVGEKAQEVIDKAMEQSDAFLFIHTEGSAESVWIQKELKYAMLRNIPVIWVQIDGADISRLRFTPSEEPHLKYQSSDFKDHSKLVKIADEILQKVFEKLMVGNDKIFDFLESIQKLFGSRLKKIDQTNQIYEVSVQRKNYHYPQREIRQYFQLYGRTPKQQDIHTLKKVVESCGAAYDSVLVLKDRLVKCEQNDHVVWESFENFYINWSRYLTGQREERNMEVVISGAFTDGDELYKQSLTDALVIFARTVLRGGYRLTFGSHPTFQELFFEVAKEVCGEDSKKNLNMYISKWFEDQYRDKKELFLSKAALVETEKKESLKESLTVMRRKMIQREKNIALLCLGGKIKDDKSEEGIREEINLARAFGIPVFVVGSVGGCSSEIAAEHKCSGFKKLNNAPRELNEMLMEKPDYFNISQELLKYLDTLK